MIELLKKLNELKQTPRIGWLEAGIKLSEAEDVAQHTFETSAITLLLIESIGENISKEKALRMAIIHDWAESVTGDFSKEVTEQIGSKIKLDIEESAMEYLLAEDIHSRQNYIDLWQEYCKGETKESKLVHTADRISILIEASKLFRRGKNSEKLSEIWKSSKKEVLEYAKEFPQITALIKELEDSTLEKNKK